MELEAAVGDTRRGRGESGAPAGPGGGGEGGAGVAHGRGRRGGTACGVGVACEAGTACGAVAAAACGAARRDGRRRSRRAARVRRNHAPSGATPSTSESMPHWPWSSRRPVRDVATTSAPARPDSSATPAPSARSQRGTWRPQRATNASATSSETSPRPALPSCATAMLPSKSADAGAGWNGTPSSPRAAMIVLPTAYSRLNRAAMEAGQRSDMTRMVGAGPSDSRRDLQPGDRYLGMTPRGLCSTSDAEPRVPLARPAPGRRGRLARAGGPGVLGEHDDGRAQRRDAGRAGTHGAADRAARAQTPRARGRVRRRDGRVRARAAARRPVPRRQRQRAGRALHARRLRAAPPGQARRSGGTGGHGPLHRALRRLQLRQQGADLAGARHPRRARGAARRPPARAARPARAAGRARGRRRARQGSRASCTT